MTAPIDQESTFQEDLYLVPEKVTVIVSKPWSSISEPDRQLLQKILQAARLSLASVRILHQTPLNLGALHPKPARAIYFGEPVSGLAWYECIRTDGAIVLAPHLDLLQNDPSGKQKLWVALKQLFGL